MARFHGIRLRQQEEYLVVYSNRYSPRNLTEIIILRVTHSTSIPNRTSGKYFNPARSSALEYAGSQSYTYSARYLVALLLQVGIHYLAMKVRGDGWTWRNTSSTDTFEWRNMSYHRLGSFSFKSGTLNACRDCFSILHRFVYSLDPCRRLRYQGRFS